MDTVAEKRKQMVAEHFTRGIPRLWCPLLTHYRDDGDIDFERMSRHFDYVVPWVKGFLVPGSTGDGWDLNREQTLQVADFAMEKAMDYEISLLVGVLRSDVQTMVQTISDLLRTNVLEMNREQRVAVLKAKHISGFTICPPSGRMLEQADIETGLDEILGLGMPTALYQLPQVTGNEISPETFARIVSRYANVVFFKDSSGQDRIALSAFEKEGVFMVRGAEGGYAQWLKEASGPYDGFLLSTANCFAGELTSLMEALKTGDPEKGKDISGRLSAAINEVFSLVQTLPSGNVFTNANKAIDHFYAYGPQGASRRGPMLHGRVRLPEAVIEATGAVLVRYRLMPEAGYCQ